MKVLFYDGWLCHFLPKYSDYKSIDRVIDAGVGPSKVLNTLKSVSPNSTIITNSILALNNDYAWDDENNRPNIFIWVESKNNFVNIQDLTDKEIRKAHNIAKMYIAGTIIY